MSDVLLTVLTSPPALSLYAIAATISVGILIKKYPWIKKYTDIAVDVFAYIESNYMSWNIRGSEKMDYFVKEFIARYYTEYGKVPTQEIIENAVKLVESLIVAQNSVTKAA